MLETSPDSFVLKNSVAKIACEPGWRWAKRDKPMPNYDLFYVWDGEGEVILNERKFAVSKGSCFLFKPGDETSATHNPERPLVLTYIHFDVNGTVRNIPEPYRVVRETLDFEFLLSRYVRVFLSGRMAARTEAQLILKQLMIFLLREDQEEPEQSHASRQLVEVIREAANYVRQHPGLPHRAEDLARRANLSPRYFALKFKELIGVPVQTYIIRTKIERAEHLLHYAGMTVTEVAEALGYRDIFYFSRQFKQYTGKNPSEIR